MAFCYILLCLEKLEELEIHSVDVTRDTIFQFDSDSKAQIRVKQLQFPPEHHP